MHSKDFTGKVGVVKISLIILNHERSEIIFIGSREEVGREKGQAKNRRREGDI